MDSFIKISKSKLIEVCKLTIERVEILKNNLVKDYTLIFQNSVNKIRKKNKSFNEISFEDAEKIIIAHLNNNDNDESYDQFYPSYKFDLDDIGESYFDSLKLAQKFLNLASSPFVEEIFISADDFSNLISSSNGS